MDKPIILQEGSSTIEQLEDLKKNNKIWQVCDNYVSQLEELFVATNPASKIASDYKDQLAAFIDERKNRSTTEVIGDWIYYPWNGNLVHTLNREESFLVRTSRNHNIVTVEEQELLRKASIGILGMSIGNGMAVNLAYAGMSEKMKIADFDTLELSNLNRIRAGLQYLGLPKTSITAQQIFEINPYADVNILDKGVNNDNLEDFVSGDPKPKLILEAIDDFEMKIKVRILSKKHKVPVVMLTNLGDRLLVDVERYDTQPETQIFNGLIGNIAEDILNNPVSEEDKKRYAIELIGKENIPKRVVESVMQVNVTLAGRPQMMSMVSIGAGAAVYLSRKLILGEDLPSGRYLIDFDQAIKK